MILKKGNNKPPERELLDRIIAELHLEEFPDIRNRLYDLAAKKEKDVPADIKEYLMENESILKIIRTAKAQMKSKYGQKYRRLFNCGGIENG